MTMNGPPNPEKLRGPAPNTTSRDTYLRLTEQARKFPPNFEALAESAEEFFARELTALPPLDPQDLSPENDLLLNPVIDSVYRVMMSHMSVDEAGLGSIDTGGRLSSPLQSPENVTLIKSALKLCIVAHSGQKRKSLDRPFAVHPVMTTWIAVQWTDDPTVLAACLLHDVIEDSADRYSDVDQSIMEALGNDDKAKHVLDIVRLVTKDNRITDKDSKNKAYLDTIRQSNSPEALMTVAADKTHNLYTTKRDISSSGGNWGIFKEGREGRRAWYGDVYKVIEDETGADSIILQKLQELRRDVFPEDFELAT